MAPKRRKSSSSADRRTKGKSKIKDRKTRSPTPQEKSDYPDYIFPMVLTSATQELLGCCADKDVTRENPYKLLNKDDIIGDIKTRAAMSEFSPVKQIVLDYPEEMMLLVYDWNFTYDRSFFLVLTPEARDRIFSPPEPEPPEEVQDEVIKTPKSKPWISFGSEQDVDDESVRESRVKLHYKFSRVRRKFGLAISFSNRNAAVVKESSQKCPSNQDSRFSIKQMQRDCGIQVEQKLQSSSAQTHWKFLRNVFTHYEPSQLSEMEKTTALQSEGLKTFCNSVFTSVLQPLQEEAIMNTCIDDWKVLETADAGDWALKASEGLPFYQAFADQKYSKGKKISIINWHPTIQGVVAVALTDIRKEQWEESSTSDVTAAFIVFYCFSDPSSAQLLLECPDDVLAFDFCPSNPNIIVGGCVNGQVVLWDISTQVIHLQEAQTGAKKASVNTEAGDYKDDHKTPVVCHCVVSAPESSHKAPITDVQWLPQTFHLPGAEDRKAPTSATKTGLPVENKYSNSVQVVTCSPDCTVMFWDVQIPNLPKQNVDPTAPATSSTASDEHSGQTWKPLLRIFITKNEERGEFAPLKISLEPSTWSQNTSSNTEKSIEDKSSEVIPESSQPAYSPKTFTPEDGNTNFYMGTEDGEIVYADWKLVHEDSGRMYSTKPLFCRRIHHGLVNTVQRSPFYKDTVLTVGGQNFAIWKEDVKDGPVIVSPSSEEECTAGCWSPARPAVFFIGKDNGSIEVWNLLTNACAPSQVYPYVTNVKITCIKPWILSPKQHLLAVVDLGMLRVFELPRTLRTPVKKESLNVTKYFELERDRLLDCLKTQEVCERPQQEVGGQKKETDKPEESLQDSKEANMKEYSDYLKLRVSLKTVAPNLLNEDG